MEKLLDHIENRDNALKLYEKIEDEKVKNFLLDLLKIFDDRMKTRRAVTHEYKYWFEDGQKCAVYVRPSTERIDIYPAFLTRSQLTEMVHQYDVASLRVLEDTNNKDDQFEARIVVDSEWLSKNDSKATYVVRLVEGILGYLKYIPGIEK